MEFRYWKENVLMCGEMNSGKTYTTRKLLENIPKQNIIIVADKTEYEDYTPDKIYLRVSPVKPYNFTWIDDVIKTCYDKQLYRKVVVFDDIDKYIHHDRESEGLAQWFIDSSHLGMDVGLTKDEAGSGSIILCKRPVSLDKRVLQACRWIFLFKGMLYEDVERVQKTCGLPEAMLGGDGVLQDKPEKDSYAYIDSLPLEQHPYLLVDKQLKTCKYRAGMTT